MTFKPATRGREHSEPMKQVIDPAGWLPEDMIGTNEWIYTLSDTEILEILGAVDALKEDGKTVLDVTRENFILPVFDQRLSILRDELLHGRGFFLLRGLPIEDMSLELSLIHI